MLSLQSKVVIDFISGGMEIIILIFFFVRFST